MNEKVNMRVLPNGEVRYMRLYKRHGMLKSFDRVMWVKDINRATGFPTAAAAAKARNSDATKLSLMNDTQKNRGLKMAYQLIHEHRFF